MEQDGRRNLINLLYILYLKRKQRVENKHTIGRERRWWVRPVNRNRENSGEFRRVILELKLHDSEWFFTYTRMSPTLFENLLSIVGPKLKKRNIRKALCPSPRLIITLRHLATGDNTFSIANSFLIGRSTVCVVIREVRRIIWEELSPIVLPTPSEQSFKDVASNFLRKWQMPHCLGAIDGKHIKITAPPNSGSLYFNYKKHFSIILLAVSDADYNFQIVDVGAYGSISDGGVFAESDFGKSLLNDDLPIPPNEELLGTDEVMSYFFVGDGAFPLRRNLMRPFAGHHLDILKGVFNYRLSRARRIIENTFGILAARWRIFHRTIEAAPDSVDDIIKATVCLHNFIRKSKFDKAKYCPPNYTDTGDVLGMWRNEVENCIFTPCNRLASNNPSRQAIQLREKLARYLLTPSGFKNGQIEYVKRIG